MVALTKRQKEVYDQLVNTPLSRKEIGEKLFITRGAVGDHTNKIMDRLGAFSRVELMYRHHVLKEQAQHE